MEISNFLTIYHLLYVLCPIILVNWAILRQSYINIVKIKIDCTTVFIFGKHGRFPKVITFQVFTVIHWGVLTYSQLDYLGIVRAQKIRVWKCLSGRDADSSFMTRSDRNGRVCQREGWGDVAFCFSEGKLYETLLCATESLTRGPTHRFLHETLKGAPPIHYRAPGKATQHNGA